MARYGRPPTLLAAAPSVSSERNERGDNAVTGCP
jgi:hypothetical protein